VCLSKLETQAARSLATITVGHFVIMAVIQFAENINGAKLAYRITGPEDGVLMITLHGGRGMGKCTSFPPLRTTQAPWCSWVFAGSPPSKPPRDPTSPPYKPPLHPAALANYSGADFAPGRLQGITKGTMVFSARSGIGSESYLLITEAMARARKQNRIHSPRSSTISTPCGFDFPRTPVIKSSSVVEASEASWHSSMHLHTANTCHTLFFAELRPLITVSIDE
jgi:hypothetical protein